MAAVTPSEASFLDRLPPRLRLTPRAYAIITKVALVFVAGIIVTGGGVRLTGSGLGCPDWPTCTSDSLVNTPETGAHGAIEFLNRQVTGLISIAVIAATLGALARVPRRKDLTRLALGLVGGIVLQIVLGGITVKSHLHPVAVGSHFLASQLIVWNAVVLVWRASVPPGPRRPIVGPWVRRGATAAVPLLITIMVVGVGLTGTGPHSGSHDGQPVQRFAFHPPTVARIHGVLVEVFTVVILVTLVVAWRQRAPRDVLRRGSVVLAVAIVQSVIGYVQYFNGIPALLVAAHILGVTLLWMAVLRFHLGLREPVAPAEDGALLVSLR